MADFDTLLRNGTIVDGTGSPRHQADIGLRDGRIAAVGDLSSKSSDRVLDIRGQIVAPASSISTLIMMLRFSRILPSARPPTTA